MSALSDIEVRHVPTRDRTGAQNMAYDAIAAERAATDGIATVRVYGWEPSTLSLGYAQDPETIDWEYCAAHDIHVTRRPTGGGAIYHDQLGDISYSIVAPGEVLPSDLMASYRLLCEPVIDAFSRMGVPVAYIDSERDGIYQPACYLRDLHPSHDLVVPGTPDRKISGNAQYRRRSAIVQHGSLTYKLSPERHLNCFASKTLEGSTFRDRVTAIDEHVDITRDTAIANLEDALISWAEAESGTWTAEEHAKAADLCEEKFDATAWVRDRTAVEME